MRSTRWRTSWRRVASAIVTSTVVTSTVVTSTLVVGLLTPTAAAGPAARPPAHPGDPRPGPTSDAASPAVLASVRARDTGRRVEVEAERSPTGRVFANPDGTFRREEHLRPTGIDPTDIHPGDIHPTDHPATPRDAPEWSSTPGGWAMVYGVPDRYRDQSYWLGDGDGVAKAGYSTWGPGPTVLARSYFQYDVRALAGKQVLSAEFNVFETYAPSCKPKVVQLWQTGLVEPWTTWNTQPPAVRELDSRDVAHGHQAACAADWIGFDATPAAIDAAGGNGFATLMVRAKNEGDALAWKKFRPDPTLIVTYNSLPDRPAALSVGDLGCGVQPDEPYTSSTTPTLRATVTDPDRGPVAAEFEWWERGVRPVGARTTVTQESGTPFSVTLPPDVFGDGARIGWRVRGWDGHAHGAWSQWCDVTVDRTAPTKRPLVSSEVYPQHLAGGGVGQTGAFTLSADGDPDVVRFRYGLIWPPLKDARAVDGAATVPVTPGTGQAHDLYVVGLDRAGNESEPSVYHFMVAGTRVPPVHHWRMDGRWPATSVPDNVGPGADGVLERGPPEQPPQAAWTTGRVDDAVAFDGRAGHLSMGERSTVHTAGSFSVAAWVRLDDLDGPWRTAVSQDGARAAGYYLQYRSDAKQWAFTVPTADTDGFQHDRVSAPIPVRAGEWTHLAGVYDAGEREIRLYVDGRFAGAAPHTTPWHAAGPVQVGRARFQGAHTDHWPGAIDDVRLYDRVLDDGRVNVGDPVAAGTDIHSLAGKPAVEEGRWAFEENLPAVPDTPAGTADTSGRHRHGAPQGGATWTAGFAGGTALALDGVDDHVLVPEPVTRTDSGFTVTARVRANALGTVGMTAVSRDGDRISGFTLGYDGTRRQWVFAVPTADADTAEWSRAPASVPVEAGKWTHLAGVYDASAEQVRLYVDGELEAVERTLAPAPPVGGALRIGQGRAAGGAADRWAGAIDDVRVHAGWRTPDQIRNEVDDSHEGVPFTRDGLHRYLGHDGEHATIGGTTSARLAPPGGHLEHELGWFAGPDAPGTMLLYSCLVGADHFTSTDPNCEGRQRLAVLGAVYAQVPADEPVVALYRCTTETGEHFDSIFADCEGRHREFRLGYLRAYAALTRYVQPDHPGDHQSSVGGVPATYRPEGRIGVLSLVQRPDTTPLYACSSTGGADAYSSLAQDCEGGRLLRVLGWIGTRPLPEDEGYHLRRCRVTGSGERFDSTSASCEGQTFDTSLGHLLRRP